MKIKHILLLAFAFGMLGLKAQDSILTISKAVEIGKNNNPVLQQMQEQKKQQKLLKKTSTGIYNPELSYFKEGMNEDAQAPFSEQRIALTQQIDFPLESYYRLKSIDNEYFALEYQQEAYERDLQAQIKSQYTRILYASHIQNLRKKQIKLNQEMYNAVRTKVEMGEATEMQLISIEVQLNEAKNKLDLAEKQLHEARYNLFSLMGLDPEEQKYSINFMDTLQTYPEYINQDTALNFIANSPDIHSVNQLIESSNNKVREARMGYFPDVSFSYYQQDYGSGFEYNGFEVGISIPLWGGITQRGMVQRYQAQNRELNHKKYEIQLQIKKEIEHAWHGYETLKRNINRYETSIRSRASELLDKTLEAYRLGQIDLLELLNAQRIFLNSEATYLETLRDYYLQMIELEKYTNHTLVY